METVKCMLQELAPELGAEQEKAKEDERDSDWRRIKETRSLKDVGPECFARVASHTQVEVWLNTEIHWTCLV